MRIRTARLIACLAASGLVASCAGGGSSGPDLTAIDKSFLGGIGSYDLNHDGVVTCDEWRTAAASKFTKANKSASGFLNPDEFQNLATSDRTFVAANFKYYDVNNDGKVDKKEFVERPNPAFTYGDKDKDCRLTDIEQAAARSVSAPPQASVHDRVTTGAPNTQSAAPGGGGGRY
jgi:Ca2+-binding EF-hand superfamily protein